MWDSIKSEASGFFSSRRGAAQMPDETDLLHGGRARFDDDTTSSEEDKAAMAANPHGGKKKRKRPDIVGHATRDELVDHILNTFEGTRYNFGQPPIHAKCCLPRNPADFFSKISVTCALAAVLVGVFMPTDNITVCRKAFCLFSALMVGNQGMTMIHSFRDDAIIHYPKNDIAEYHFLSRSVPVEGCCGGYDLALPRLMAVGGFLCGVAASIIGIILMDATEWTKVYMLTSMSYFASAVANRTSLGRDIMEAKVWRNSAVGNPKEMDPHRNLDIGRRRTPSSKVKNAIMNVMHAVHKTNVVNGTIFFIILLCNLGLTTYTVIRLKPKGGKHEHKAVYAGCLVFSIAGGLLMGKLLNANSFLLHKKGKQSPEDHTALGLMLVMFLLTISTGGLIVSIFLMENSFVHTAIMVIASASIIDTSSNISHVVSKYSNVWQLVKELGTRLDWPGYHDKLKSYNHYLEAKEDNQYQYQDQFVTDHSYAGDPSHSMGSPAFAGDFRSPAFAGDVGYTGVAHADQYH